MRNTPPQGFEKFEGIHISGDRLTIGRVVVRHPNNKEALLSIEVQPEGKEPTMIWIHTTSNILFTVHEENSHYTTALPCFPQSAFQSILDASTP